MSYLTRWRRVGWAAFGYLVSILVSRILSPASSTYVTFWLPAGTFVAALLLLDVGDWLAAIAVIDTVNVGCDLGMGTPLPLAVGFAAANTVAAVMSGLLFRHFYSPAPRLGTLREYLGFVACAVAAGTALGGAVGAFFLVRCGYQPSFRIAWETWWLGNSMAVLLVAPVVLIWVSPPEPAPRRTPTSASGVEQGLCAAALAACTWRVFASDQGVFSPHLPALLLFLVWGSLRFGLRGASALILGNGLWVTYLIARHQAGPTPADGSLAAAMQTYLAVSALVGLIPAIAIEERRGLLGRLADNEEHLRKARDDDFRFLADAMPQIVWTGEPDGNIVYYNHRWIAYTGLTLKQTRGGGWQAVLHPDDRADCVARWTRAVAAGSDYEFEYRLRRGSDGSYRWHLGRAFPQRDAGGRVIRWVGTSTDIHEQKQFAAELERRISERTAALKESEEQFRMAFDFAGIGMALVGLDGRWLRVNAALCKLLGFAAQDLLRRSVQELIHPEDGAAAREHAEALVSGEQQHFQIEQRYLDRAGAAVWVRQTASLVRSEGGAPIHLVYQIEDISLQRRAAEALRDSEERYRSMVETVEDYAIFLLDPAGRVASWNTGAQRTKGYATEEILGAHHSVFYLPEERDRATDLIATAARTGKSEAEGWRVRKDGTRFWANVIITALHDPGGRLLGFSKVTRDITRRKELQDSLVQRNAELEVLTQRAQQANQLKSEFLSNMSHELRTPLNGIIGFCSFLVGEKPGPLNAKQREYLGDVLNSSKHLLQLINDLLDLARIEAGKIELRPELFSMRELVQEVLAGVGPLLEEKRLNVTASFALGEGLLSLDAQRIKQVLFNLISNAIKFTDAGGRLEIQVNPLADDRLEIRVSDSGIGIAAADLPRLFVDFERLGGETTRHVQGTGLGLAVTKKLVELHRGAIRVESEVKRGSTFIVTLPRTV